MSTAFIIIYENTNENISCPTFSDKLVNDQTNDNNIIYHIFNHKNYEQSFVDIYKQFYSENLKNNKFIVIDFEQDLSETINDIHKYEKFIIINPNLAFKSGTYQILTNSNYKSIVPINSNTKHASIYTRSEFIDIIRKKLNIKDILNKEKELPVDNYYQASDVINQKTQPPKNSKATHTDVFYEDNNCLFCMLGKKSNLIESPVYFNKNNNKVFNVTNNIFGNVMSYNGESIVVIWKMDTGFHTHTYHKLNNMFV